MTEINNKEEHTMKKRFFSLLMAFCLMLSLAPAAFAANATVTTADQLTNAISSASAGDTITLGANITLTDTVIIDKAVTIDGSGHTLTAGDFTAVKITASGVTLKNMNIQTDVTGINFDASGLTGKPTLDVVDTNITKTTVDQQTGVCYITDNRGINTTNVKGGIVTISGCKIIGFKYGINPIIVPESGSSLRDGNGTIFDVFDTVVKGWTALNMWSANTEYYFTDCTLIGVNNLSGDSNNYSVIIANDGIYGNVPNTASTVTISGGSLTAVKYGESDQTVFSVDNEYKTDFVFTSENPVSIKCYRSENTATQRFAHVWNFYFFDYIINPGNAEKKAAQYMKDHVTGYSDDMVTAGTISEYESTVALMSCADDGELRLEQTAEQGHVGGAEW